MDDDDDDDGMMAIVLLGVFRCEFDGGRGK